jgi:sugar O-acyltransferase (sialic acid O-acetyltransferase NeuD family)
VDEKLYQMKKLMIFPFSGTGIEALDCLGDEWSCTGFISDDPQWIGKNYFGIPIYDRSRLLTDNETYVLAVPGSPDSFLKREEIITALNIPDDKLAIVIHPKAAVGSHVKLGFNALIMAGVVITSNAMIGNHVCVLPNTTIHHDSVIEDYTLIGGNVLVAGNVTISKNCYIGAGTNIKNGVTIAAKTLVGLGSNVISDIIDKKIVFGNPAK